MPNIVLVMTSCTEESLAYATDITLFVRFETDVERGRNRDSSLPVTTSHVICFYFVSERKFRKRSSKERTKLPRTLSCGNLPLHLTMTDRRSATSQQDQERAERVAKYKEERRRQLQAQIAAKQEPQADSPVRTTPEGTPLMTYRSFFLHSRLRNGTSLVRERPRRPLTRINTQMSAVARTASGSGPREPPGCAPRRHRTFPPPTRQSLVRGLAIKNLLPLPPERDPDYVRQFRMGPPGSSLCWMRRKSKLGLMEWRKKRWVLNCSGM